MLSQRLAKPKRPFPITSTGHAELFQTPQGEWFAVFLGCRPWLNDTEQLGRETFLMPVRWSQDSFPYITQNLDLVPRVQNRPNTAQLPRQTGNICDSTTFTTPLSPAWISMWGSADKYVSTGKKGLMLQFAPVNASSGKTPAFVGRRIQNQEFDVTTTLSLPSDAQQNDGAGLLVVKTERRQIFFAVYPGAIKVIKPGAGVVDEIKTETLGKAITLRLSCTDGVYHFAYSTGDGLFTELPATISAEYVSSSAGGFTGTVVGLFATSASM